MRRPKVLRRSACAAYAVLAATVGPAAVGQTMYTVTDLGTLGGAESRALGISDAGHVVGWAETGEMDESGSPIRHAFLWDDGILTDLGTLGGPNSEARRVNSTGQAVGWAETPAPVEHAFIWLPEDAYGLPAGMADLGALVTAQASRAHDINESGQLLLSSGRNTYIWYPETAFGLPAGMNDITPSYGRVCFMNWLCGLNDSSHVVGAHLVWLPTPAYGRPSGWSEIWVLHTEEFYSAVDVNNRGVVIAREDPFIRYHGYDLVTESTFVFPLELRGVSAINDFDQVACGTDPLYDAGLCEQTAPGTWEAWNLNHWVFPNSGWMLYRAMDINDSGEIVGSGANPDGQMHGYLLTPVDADFDDDQDTDLTDFDRWRACLAGPGRQVEAECEDRDLDRDGNVDLLDFYGLQRLFTGAR